MKKEYDFSHAEKGKFYMPESEIEIPIYLKGKVKAELTRLAQEKHLNISEMVNDILDKEIKLHKTYFSSKS
jgi:hypothetical protein